MKTMNDSYGIPRGSMPTGRIEASMASRFPVHDEAGNEDTLVCATWDGQNLRFNPMEINGAPINLEQWESHATPQGNRWQYTLAPLAEAGILMRERVGTTWVYSVLRGCPKQFSAQEVES